MMLLRLMILHKAAMMTVLALFPFLCLIFSLLCELCRMRTMAKLLLVSCYLHNVRSQSTSCKRGQCMSRSDKIRLRIAYVMYTCFITPHWCPCLLDETSVLHGNMPQRNDEEGGKQPRLFFCRVSGARWASHGQQAAEMRRAPRIQSRRRTTLPSSINSSDSPTTLPSLMMMMSFICSCRNKK
jgi:hypothetical protein